MKKYTLTAEKRDLVGRKVKNLRKMGKLPVTVYGKSVPSVSATISADAFATLYADAGYTGLIEMSLGGEVRPVLVHVVQRDALSGVPLHVEFHQVDLKEKVHANVPVELVGEAPAVVGKVGVLLTLLDEVEVEALPTDLPEKITADVSQLAEVDHEVKVKDLVAPKGVTILTDAEQSIVRVGSLVSKEAEAQAAEEAAAAAATPAEGEAAPAEGAAEPAKPEATEEK